MNRVLCTSSYKITKGERLGYMTSVLYLAPFTLSGINVCPHAKLETCAAACLNTSGRGSINRTQESRIARTKWFHSDRESFVEAMVKNLEANIRRAHRLGFTPCIRPNGTSDLPWENITHKGKRIMEIFSNVQWYDYTKVPLRMKKFLNGDMPDNYHLTFSRSGDNDRAVNEVMQLQGNVSVVFRGGLPDTWNGVRVIDGDEHDLRFTDPKGVIVGLSAKGKARKMDTKFVVNN
jgi:hypothetical protein